MTIDDIAGALGVSKTTVSRAISGNGRVGAETRERVLEYIRCHNYRPNLVAKGLAKQRTYNIAVVWPGDYTSFDLPFFQRLLIGINSYLSERDYDIIIAVDVGNDYTSLKRIVDNRKCDGVILTRTLKRDKTIAYLQQEGIPFVTVGSCNDASVTQIDNDNRGACCELTQILLAKGYKRLVLIGGPSDQVVNEQRYEGFTDAYIRAGASPEEGLAYMDVVDDMHLHTVLSDIIKRHVDGIVCMDDYLAAQTLIKCHTDEIRIPEDIKLASFYDSSALRNSVPSITSIRFDDHALGEEAAKAILQKLDGCVPQNEKLRQYNVVLRESTQ